MPKKDSAAPERKRVPRPSLMDAARAVVAEEAAGEYRVDRPSEVLPDRVGVVAVDTETSGLFADDGARVSVVSVAWREPSGEIRSVAFPFDQGPRDKLKVVQTSLFDAPEDVNLPAEEWEYLLSWLDREGQRLVFHNAKFDLEKLRVGTRHWPGRCLLHRLYWDTQIANKEIWPLENTSLKPTAVRLWGEGEDDEQAAVRGWLKKMKLTMGDADKVPWEIIGPYAAKDTHQTLRLFYEQDELVELGVVAYGTLLRRFDVTRVLYQMEKRGLGYDAAGSLDAAELIETKAAEIEARLPFSPPNVTGAKKYFFGTLGLKSPKQTERGADSLDDEVLWSLSKKGVAGAADYALYSKYNRAVSMWYRGYPDMIGADGRLRTCFRQSVVKSGRMSVERVQLQAIPKGDKDFEGVPGVRSFVRARDGYELWNLDLSQAELRVASRYSNCTRMLAMLADGADLHSITCEQVLRVPKTAPDFKTQRDIAKRLTFGGIFQVGPKTFRETLLKLAHIDMPLRQAEEIVYGWRDMYPEFTRAYKAAERAASTDKRVRLLRGTEYETWSYFGERDWPNTGWNRIVQGSLAEFLQLWLPAAERICVEAGHPDALILTVHDSVVLELPIGEGAEVAKRVALWAEREATRLFGIDMKVDVGPWHSPMADKKAKGDDQYAAVSGR